MSPTQQVYNLEDLQNYSYQRVQIKRLGSDTAKSIDFQVNQMNILVFENGLTRTRIDIPHQIDFIMLAKRFSMILHARRSAHIPINKHADPLPFLHYNTYYIRGTI